VSAPPAGATAARRAQLGPGVLPLLLALACHGGTGEPRPPRERETPPPQPAARLDLRDFGARGDGTTDDGPALRRALEALKAAGGGVVHVPAGRYVLASPVEVDFTGLDASVEVAGVASATPAPPAGAAGHRLSQGLDLASELLPRTGAERALVLAGARRAVLRDLAFVGTPDVPTDAFVTLTLRGIADARILHCEFYGLGTLDGPALVLAEGSGLSVERSVFLGSSTNSARNAAMVENLDWQAISVADTTFLDYGGRPELHSKTAQAPPFAWIGIGNAAAPPAASPRREVIVRDVFFDEGALSAVAATPARQGRAPSARIDLLYATGVRMNVSNLRTNGFHLDGIEAVLVEDSRFGWSQRPGAAIHLLGVREAILSRVACEPQIPCLRRSPSTGRTWVMASTGPGIAESGAEVVPVRDERDDVVLHVRRELARRAGREPDPALHYDWSRRILLCGGDVRCEAERRGELASRLSRGGPLGRR
jgi:hypothetical protein